MPRLLILLLPFLVIGCLPQEPETESPMPDGTFGADVAFLEKYTDSFMLQQGDAAIAVAPGMQGRVMTSSANGTEGKSFGWINYDLIRSGEVVEHINAYGGEERFWLGPEGGQFSIYFAPGDPFDLDHWQVPAAIDTEPFELVSKDATSARFHRDIELTNYSNTDLRIAVDREVRLLDRAGIAELLGMAPDEEVGFVAYQTKNTISNAGDVAWTKETGMVSIWILGMYNPTPATTVVVPFVEGPEEALGPIVNDAYFGKVPSDRLVEKDGVLFFKGDGLYRSKIGLTPQRARAVLGSYDADGNVLTIVHYNKPDGAAEYVNSMWEIQDSPFTGDVVNSYNDGPPEPGAEPMGPFYELESSSPAASLAPQESLLHQHTTVHFTGPEEKLNQLAMEILGVDLETIKTAFQSDPATDETGMRVIGHRGASGHLPENTLAAFEKALDLGATWIELDVHLCDGEVVVIHDDTVDRTTNGTGLVDSFSFEDLRALDAGDGEQIPTLTQVFDAVGDRAAINVELKGSGTATPVAHILTRLVESGMWTTDRMLVSSFDHGMLEEVIRTNPDIPIGALFGKDADNPVARTLELGGVAVNIPLDLASEELVSNAHARNLEVLVYTVNRPEDIERMRDLGVDGVFSDFPDRVLVTR